MRFRNNTRPQSRRQDTHFSEIIKQLSCLIRIMFNHQRILTRQLQYNNPQPYKLDLRMPPPNHNPPPPMFRGGFRDTFQKPLF